MSALQPGTTMFRIAELERITCELRADLNRAQDRIEALEASTPQARQLQYEADVAMADAAEYNRHGRDCQCAYCYVPTEPEDLNLDRERA